MRFRLRGGFTGLEIITAVVLIVGLIAGAGLVQRKESQNVSKKAYEEGCGRYTSAGDCPSATCDWVGETRSCSGKSESNCTSTSGCEAQYFNCAGFGDDETRCENRDGCTFQPNAVTCAFANGTCPAGCTYSRTDSFCADDQGTGCSGKPESSCRPPRCDWNPGSSSCTGTRYVGGSCTGSPYTSCSGTYGVGVCMDKTLPTQAPTGGAVATQPPASSSPTTGATVTGSATPTGSSGAGQTCYSNSQCSGNLVCSGSRCVVPTVAVAATATIAQRQENQACTGSGQGNCASGLVCVASPYGSYCKTPACSGNQKQCSTVGGVSQVQTCSNSLWVTGEVCPAGCALNPYNSQPYCKPTPTPTEAIVPSSTPLPTSTVAPTTPSKKGTGQACSSHAECTSNYCAAVAGRTGTYCTIYIPTSTPTNTPRPTRTPTPRPTVADFEFTDATPTLRPTSTPIPLSYYQNLALTPTSTKAPTPTPLSDRLKRAITLFENARTDIEEEKALAGLTDEEKRIVMGLSMDATQRAKQAEEQRKRAAAIAEAAKKLADLPETEREITLPDILTDIPVEDRRSVIEQADRIITTEKQEQAAADHRKAQLSVGSENTQENFILCSTGLDKSACGKLSQNNRDLANKTRLDEEAAAQAKQDAEKKFKQDLAQCALKCDGTCVVGENNAIKCIAYQTAVADKSCGNNLQECCLKVENMYAPERYCHAGLKCWNNAMCVVDSEYQKNVAVASAIAKTGNLDPASISTILSANGVSVNDDLAKALTNACDCDGSCQYSQAKKALVCVSAQDILDQYTSSQTRTKETNGELGQACNNMLETWLNFGKQACNSPLLSCVDNTCQINQAGKEAMAANYMVTSGSNSLEIQLGINATLMTSATRDILQDRRLARSGCPASKREYYIQNGQCYICVGGQNAPAAASLCLAQPEIPEAPKEGLGKACTDYYQLAACPAGLTCFEDKCQDPLVLAFDPKFQNGKAEGIKNIPVLGLMLGGVARAMPGSTYYDSVATRAQLAFDQAQQHPELTSSLYESLDPAAQARYTVLQLDKQTPGQTSFANLAYKSLARVGEFASAYNDAGNQSAFLNYAKTNADINQAKAEGKLDEAGFLDNVVCQNLGQLETLPGVGGIVSGVKNATSKNACSRNEKYLRFTASNEFGNQIAAAVTDIILLPMGDSLLSSAGEFATKKIVTETGEIVIKETATSSLLKLPKVASELLVNQDTTLGKVLSLGEKGFLAFQTINDPRQIPMIGLSYFGAGAKWGVEKVGSALEPRVTDIKFDLSKTLSESRSSSPALKNLQVEVMVLVKPLFGEPEYQTGKINTLDISESSLKPLAGGVVKDGDKVFKINSDGSLQPLKPEVWEEISSGDTKPLSDAVINKLDPKTRIEIEEPCDLSYNIWDWNLASPVKAAGKVPCVTPGKVVNTSTLTRENQVVRFGDEEVTFKLNPQNPNQVVITKPSGPEIVSKNELINKGVAMTVGGVTARIKVDPTDQRIIVDGRVKQPQQEVTADIPAGLRKGETMVLHESLTDKVSTMLDPQNPGQAIVLFEKGRNREGGILETFVLNSERPRKEIKVNGETYVYEFTTRPDGSHTVTQSRRVADVPPTHSSGQEKFLEEMDKYIQDPGKKIELDEAAGTLKKYQPRSAISSGYKVVDLATALKSPPDPYGIFPELERAITKGMGNKQIIEVTSRVISEKTGIPVLLVEQSTKELNPYFVFSYKGEQYGIYYPFSSWSTMRGLAVNAYRLSNISIEKAKQDNLNTKPQRYLIDEVGKKVFDRQDKLDAIAVNSSRAGETKAVKTAIHELGHIVEKKYGSKLTEVENEPKNTEVISSLYGVKLAQIVGKFDVERAVEIGGGQVMLFNQIIHGSVDHEIRPTSFLDEMSDDLSSRLDRFPKLDSIGGIVDWFKDVLGIGENPCKLSYWDMGTSVKAAGRPCVKEGEVVRINSGEEIQFGKTAVEIRIDENGVRVGDKSVKDGGTVEINNVIATVKIEGNEVLVTGVRVFDEEARAEILKSALALRDNLNMQGEDGDRALQIHIDRLKNPELDPYKTGLVYADDIKSFAPKTAARIEALIVEKKASKPPTIISESKQPWQVPNSGPITDIQPVVAHLKKEPHIDLELFLFALGNLKTGGGVNKQIPLGNILHAPGVMDWSKIVRSGDRPPGYSVTARYSDEKLLQMIQQIRDGEFDLSNPRGENPIQLLHLGDDVYVAFEGTTRLVAAKAAGNMVTVPAIVYEVEPKYKGKPWEATFDPRSSRSQYESARDQLKSVLKSKTTYNFETPEVKLVKGDTPGLLEKWGFATVKDNGEITWKWPWEKTEVELAYTNIKTEQELWKVRPENIETEARKRYESLVDAGLEQTLSGAGVRGYIREGESQVYKYGGLDTDKIVESMVKNGSPVKVLDIGAAKGGVLIHLEDTFGGMVEVAGLSANDYRSGNKRLQEVDYRIGNAENLAGIYKPNTYDLIVSAVTITHFTDPLGAIAQMYEVLKPGGILMVDYFKLPGLEGNLDSIITFLKRNGYEISTEYHFGEGTVSQDGFSYLVIKKSKEHLELPITYSGIDNKGNAIYRLSDKLSITGTTLPKSVTDLFKDKKSKYIGNLAVQFNDFKDLPNWKVALEKRWKAIDKELEGKISLLEKLTVSNEKKRVEQAITDYRKYIELKEKSEVETFLKPAKSNSSEGVVSWVKDILNIDENPCKLSYWDMGMTVKAGGKTPCEKALELAKKVHPDITSGQVIKLTGKYYKTVDNGRATVEVLPLVERIPLSKIASKEYVNKLTNGAEVIIDADYKAWLLLPEGRRIEISEKGIYLDDGSFLKVDARGELATLTRYADTLIRHRDHQKVVWVDGSLKFENKPLTTPGGKKRYAFWMKNGELRTKGEDIRVGDIITFESGYTFRVGGDFPDKLEIIDHYPDEYEYREGELLSILSKIDLSKATEFVVESVDEQFKKNVFTDSRGLLRISIYMGSGWRSASETFDDVDLSRSFVAIRRRVWEYLFLNHPEIIDLYKEFLIQSQKRSIDRLDFGIKKLETMSQERKLTQEESEYLLYIKKVHSMWRKVISGDDDVEQYLKSLVDEENVQTRMQIEQILDNMETLKTDGPLFKSYVYGGTYMSPMKFPGVNKYSRPYTYGLLVEQAMALNLAPKKEILIHQNQTTTFWNKAFEEVNLTRPSWFNPITYRGDEISFHSQAQAGSELIMANASGEYFLGSLIGEPDITHIFNHEAAHAVSRIPNEATGRGVDRYGEITTELIAQLISRGEVTLPPKDFKLSIVYQQGVNELINVMTEINEFKGDPLLSTKLLLEGIVLYNQKRGDDKLSLIREYYTNKMNKSDFDQRLSNFQDFSYRSEGNISTNPPLPVSVQEVIILDEGS